jgi:TolB-like protein/Flp pilus assembly protein TadD
MALLREIKRRKVFQAVVAYAIAAWVIAQLVDVVNEPLHLPDWFDTVVIVFLAIGFPLAVIFAWIFDLTKTGIEKTQPFESPGAPAVKEDVAQLPQGNKSIAVLPFTNNSGDPSQDYFSDGITEDIITGLSYWRWFPVIARNSTFAYKGRAVDVKEVARDLGAQYVVEGSVRKAGDKVRVSAQLIDATTGHHVWAQRFDRDLTDVFAIQDEIAEQIVASIEPQLTQAEQSRALRKHPGNLDAWDCTLRALAEQTKMTKSSYERAHKLLDKAIDGDDSSSYALSLLSLCQYHEAIFGWSDSRAESLAASHLSARRAVAIDANDWLAQAMLGLTYLWAEREHDLAVKAVQRAVELNPSAAFAYHLLACVLEFSGRSAEAIPHLHAIKKLDPRYKFESVAIADLALSYLSLEDFEKSVDYANKAIHILRSNVRAYQRKAASLGHLGRINEAKEALKKIFELQPDFSLAVLDETYPFREQRQRDLLMTGVRKAGLTE